MSKDLSTRQRKQAVPSMKDEASWFKFCLGGSLAKADGSEEEALHIKARIVKSLEGINQALKNAFCALLNSCYVTDDMNLRKNILLASLVTANEEEENDSDGHQIALHTTPDDIDDADDKEGEDDILQEPIVIEYASGELPCNKLLLQFDQVLTQRLLGFLSNWLKFPFLQKWYIGLPPGNDESEYPSGEKIYSWIFALLSRLEKPLYMDASATVRDIYRSLSIQRNEMADYVLSQVHENSKNIENAGPAKRSRDCSKDLDLKISTLPDNIRKALALQNTVIAICGRYFGQEEIGKIADNNDYNDVSTRIQTTQSYPHSQIFSHEAYKLDGDGDY